MNGCHLEINHIWFTIFKKHLCPVCNRALKKKLRKVKIPTNTEEAKEHDFLVGDSYMMGTIQCYEVVFKCSNCDGFYSVPDMMLLEKKKGLNKR